MGLDMYAYSIRKEAARKAMITDATTYPGMESSLVSEEEIVRIQYWRKHPNLHGWMQRRYAQKTGIHEPEVFNTVNLGLTSEDIDALEETISKRELPATTGFFFGASQPEDYDLDMEFIRKARKELAEGNVIYYYSWW